MADVFIQDLNSEILTVSNSLDSLYDNLKCDFENYILKKADYPDNRCVSKESQDLVNSVSLFEQNNIIQTQKAICNLKSDIKSLGERLETTVDNYLLVNNLLTLDQCLISAVQHKETDLYKAAEHLVRAKSILDDFSKAGRLLDFYKQKNEDYYKLFTFVSMNALEKWNNLVCFKVTEIDSKARSASLSISSNHDVLESIYQTLEMLKVPYKEMFCEKLLNEFLKMILMYDCKTLLSESNNFFILTVQYSLKSVKMNFSDVINCLIKIFEFVNDRVDVKWHSLNSLISVSGSLIVNNFFMLFVEHHLAQKIPLKRENIKEYEQAIEETQRVLSVMLKKGFVNNDNSFINEYCGSAESVFENKVSQRYKELCILLMKQDLHDMLLIDSNSLTYPMPEIVETMLLTDEVETEFWKTICSTLNNDSRRRSFLKCHISKSMNKLADLAGDCLSQSVHSDSVLKANLHNTVHQILLEYLKSPEIHRKLLEIIPQQSALLFTNTVFLVMKLVHFSKDFNVEDNFFTDVINDLQKMAFRELDRQIKIQEGIAVSSLQKSGLQDLSELEVFPKTAEKAIRQCLRQSMLLQTVWMSVLPQDIYCIVIGRIVNRFIEEIIQFVLFASDIREDIANNLVDLLTLVNEKAPQVFPESREVHRYVKNWLKLRELGLVLAGSLADISERWAGGSGPLAHELEPSQVRSLIVALFQSSDIRQRTLASIR